MTEIPQYEPEVTKEFTQLLLTPPFGSVIDVGANLGYYSMLAAKILLNTGYHVWAFEPQVELVTHIYQEARRYQIPNLSVLQIALSDHNGYMDFHVPVAGMEMYGGFHQNGRFETERTVQVAVRRLDDVIHRYNIRDIKLLKLDAEGAELSILRGSSQLLSSRPTVIYENNDRNIKPYGYIPQDINDYLAEYGYRCRPLDDENWIAE